MDTDPIIPYLIGLFESTGDIWLHLDHSFYGEKMTNIQSKEKMLLPTDSRAKVYQLTINDSFKK